MSDNPTTSLSSQTFFGRICSRLSSPLSIVGAAFIAILFISVNKGAEQITKTKEELEYEKWLETTTVNRSSLNAESLPSLSLRIMPSKTEEQTEIQAKDLYLAANLHPDGKDRILRILELVRESELLSFATRSISPEQPGDLTLRIESPEKKYILRFNQDEANKNVKTTLLLKLFEEYSKDRVLTTKNSGSTEIAGTNNDLPLDLVQSLKESSATTSDLSPQEEEVAQ